MRHSRPSPRKPWSQPLADVVTPCLAAPFSRFGFDDTGLLLSWTDIVGARLGARCEPLKLQWPSRGRGPTSERGQDDAATLVVRVDGPFAIELQHQAPVLIDRINAHLGWRCIGRLALRQAPGRPRPAARQPAPPPTAEAVAAAERVAGETLADDLRGALVRLGARVLERGRPTT